MNLTYYPEGMFPESLNAGNMSREQLKKHCQDGMILEAVAQSATTGHDLIVDLGDVRGIIPREETAIGISDGTVRDIAILSRVGKPVCFRITSTEGLWEPHPYVYLSRRAAQQEALDHLLYEVPTGTVLPAVVTHLDRFGAFCDIGCGNVSLLSIEHISISRINHSRDHLRGHSLPGSPDGSDQPDPPGAVGHLVPERGPVFRGGDGGWHCPQRQGLRRVH